MLNGYFAYFKMRARTCGSFHYLKKLQSLPTKINIGKKCHFLFVMEDFINFLKGQNNVKSDSD